MEASCPVFKDNLNCKNNKAIMNQLDTEAGEEVVFSCNITKKNKYGMSQSRTFLLTNQNVYNIKGSSQIQRKIHMTNIKSLTKSIKPKNLEFVIHIKKEYDYHFESLDREQIIDALKWHFYQSFSKNLPIYGV